MQTLDNNLITMVGKHLDYKDRIKCYEASKMFNEIHYTYTNHILKLDLTIINQVLEKLHNFERILNHIVKIKPSLENITLRIDNSSDEIVNYKDLLLEKIIHLAHIAKDKKINVTLYFMKNECHSCNVILHCFKEALKKHHFPFNGIIIISLMNFCDINLIKEILTLSPHIKLQLIHDIDNKYQEFLKLKEFLECDNIMSRVIYLVLFSKSFSYEFTSDLKFSSYFNGQYELFLNNNNIQLINEYLTNLVYYDQGFAVWRPLEITITQCSKLKTLTIADSFIYNGWLSQYRDDYSWYSLAPYLKDREIIYVPFYHNIYLPYFVTNMKKKNVNIKLGYQCEDTYVFCKFIQRHVLKLPIDVVYYSSIVKKTYNPSLELENKLSEINVKEHLEMLVDKARAAWSHIVVLQDRT